MRLLSSVCLLTVLTGCAGQQMQKKLHTRNVVQDLPVIKKVKKKSVKKQVISQKFSSVQKKVTKPVTTRKVTSISDHLSDHLFDQKDDLQLDYHQNLYNFWVKYFTGKKKNKARFIRHMKNGEKYRSLISQIFKEHGLPADLYYVGLIESGFNTHIRSHADAVGPWQFIKGTGKRYGLRIDRYVDERANIIKATEAAAGYFKDLYNIFGSWELALCAYNAGEYRIINAIRKGNTRDYRDLVKKKLIPKETIYYVPKVAAARYLSKNRKKYRLPVRFESGTFYKNAVRKKVKSSFSLTRISKDLGVPYSTMKKLNPDYKGNWVKVGRKGQSVVIPTNKVSRFAKLSIAKKRVRRFASRGVSKKQRAARTKRVYRVRSGDNLYSIAKKYGVTVASLKRHNSIRGTKIHRGQRIKIPSTKKRTYIVRRGDNLTAIAKKFKTSISSITAYNNIRGNRIYKGQRIYLP